MRKYSACLTLLLLALLMNSSLIAQEITGTYAIKNVKTGLLLRPENASKKDGALIVMYNPVNWKCLTWRFINEGNNNYRLENLFSGKTFQPEGQVAEKGIHLEQTPLGTGMSQVWEFIRIKDDTYKIRLKGTQLFITPSDVNGTVNSGAILDTWKEDTLQQWTIYIQNPSV